jgi:hypothetical protein
LLIERVSPGSYLELCGRVEVRAAGWTVFGNEVERDGDVFLDSLEGFVAGGWRAGDGVVLIATREHVDGIGCPCIFRSARRRRIIQFRQWNSRAEANLTGSGQECPWTWGMSFAPFGKRCIPIILKSSRMLSVTTQK